MVNTNLEGVEKIIEILEDLMENPEFLSSLSSEAEIALDAAVDLFYHVEDMISPIEFPPVGDPALWRLQQDEEQETD